MKNLDADFEVAYVLVSELRKLDPIVATSAVCCAIENIAKDTGKDKMVVGLYVLSALRFAPEVEE